MVTELGSVNHTQWMEFCGAGQLVLDSLHCLEVQDRYLTLLQLVGLFVWAGMAVVWWAWCLCNICVLEVHSHAFSGASAGRSHLFSLTSGSEATSTVPAALAYTSLSLGQLSRALGFALPCPSSFCSQSNLLDPILLWRICTPQSITGYIGPE